MASGPLLQVRRLGFAYDGDPALFSDWSVDVTAGITALRGDSGRGKSTLLRLLAGVQPASGELTLAGMRLAADPIAYRQRVFWHEAGSEAVAQMTPLAVIASCAAEHASWDEAEAHRHLHAFALAPHLAKPLYALSTGSKRKLWLSVALGVGRTLTLLDEPSAGLDAAALDHLRRTLTDRAGRGDQAFIVVHDAALDGVPLAGVIDLDV